MYFVETLKTSFQFAVFVNIVNFFNYLSFSTNVHKSIREKFIVNHKILLILRNCYWKGNRVYCFYEEVDTVSDKHVVYEIV